MLENQFADKLEKQAENQLENELETEFENEFVAESENEFENGLIFAFIGSSRRYHQKMWKKRAVSTILCS